MGTSASATDNPRHPSAGRHNARPALVRNETAPHQLPAASCPHGADPGRDRIRLGPDLDDEALERLIGSVDNKRVLDLGCGAGAATIALAQRGARVTAVEASTARLAQARAAADLAEVRVEFHHSDLADLAFVRADQIDLCLAVYSLAEVADVSRVFRQVHRVLRTEAPFVISLPHPLELMAEADADGEGVRLRRSAFDQSRVAIPGASTQIEAHRVTDIFTALTRSNFRVDALLEPPMDPSAEGGFSSPVHEWVPATVIIRGRKQGI